MTTIAPTVLDRLRAIHECHYCGQRLGRPGQHRTNRTVDHLRPLSRGGTNDAWNLVACCQPCNRAKGSLTQDEYLAVMHDTERVKVWRDGVHGIISNNRLAATWWREVPLPHPSPLKEVCRRPRGLVRVIPA
jgi:hypothetical protein